MNNPQFNELLKWSVENSEAAQDPKKPVNVEQARANISPAALQALLGGPSDADRMREAMATIQSLDVDLENKLTAFDNFEQLVEHIDNANNMESLGLWGPLVEQLQNEEAEMRTMAAWCLGTAVQNNIKAQERLLVQGAIPTLVKLATEDPNQAVRKKAILALSSAIRNYQPSLDAALDHLPEDHKVDGPLDAGDMDSINTVIQKLRDSSHQKG